MFIRPRILRDGPSLASLSTEKYRNLQQETALKLPAISDDGKLLQAFPASRQRLDEGVW
ncbi:hypothetical protein D9M70_633920 [compost metagenome]